MMHHLDLPDYRAGRELRRIVWDDEAGTVQGTHSAVELIGSVFDQAAHGPIDFGCEWGEYILNDPAHNPSDFLAVVFRHCLSGRQRLEDFLPASLTGVKLTQGPPMPADADTGIVIY